MASLAAKRGVLIGTSGWSYAHWRGPFYPPELPQARWLEFYTQRFPTVELNNSFYRLPLSKTFQNWRTRVPQGFLFAVKASRFITHIKRLRDVAEPLETFLERARLLAEKLGPLLYQLPPGLGRDEARLSSFLALLPRDLQHVVEFRNPSWYDEGTLALLMGHNVAFCVHDMRGCATPVLATADFAYVRLHGPTGTYSGCYTKEALEEWADQVRAIGQGLKAVYIYFNNDIGGFAVANAMSLAAKLGEA
ncbi:MAG: DUF72 domain-containing protein [Dehalococcoidia bacterium]